MKNLSIKSKVLITLSFAFLLFGFAAAAISYKIYLNTSIEQHKQLAMSVAKLVADSINPDRVEDYLWQGESATDYMQTKMKLYGIRESSPHVRYIYVYKILEDGCHVIFDLDTPEVPGNDPGTIQEFDESFKPYLSDLLAGKNIPPIISDDTYGWLLTVYIPVRDDEGLCHCYAAVDMSMDSLRQQSREFLLQLAAIFALIFIIILAIEYQLINSGLISPVNKMAHSAEEFAFKNEDSIEKNLEQIENLNIHTGDEIENLYHAFVKMTEDSVQYTKDVKNKTETISKMQNALIITLADLVESRDENTGQHIKKTAAYVKIILDEMKRMGIYADQITEEFAENVYESAPLHDIGKIAVPDSILNKPGKLTPEEFDIMKKHTTAGGKILTSILELVPDSHYLYEAVNLATYHHERWDGKGYPTGLSGENIPLSARIMAVADVFDALVSKRSYKKGFPFDKAINIIIEESGTHFDSKVVDAFLAAKDKVFKVSQEFSSEEEK